MTGAKPAIVAVVMAADRLGEDPLEGYVDGGGFMILLILGLLLWWVTHLEKILAPGRRAAGVARMGEGPWKGLIAILSVAAIVIMVIGKPF